MARKLTKKDRAEQRIPKLDNDLQVLTLDQVVALDNTSKPTLIRQINAGTGPCTIRLSTRRVGVTVRDYRLWQEKRIGGA